MRSTAVVGLLGFYFHLAADFSGISSSLYNNLIFGAPVFAPLLFVNLSVLAALGIWDMMAVEEQADRCSSQAGSQMA